MRDFDPLRDKAYRDTALGPDIVAWLAWLDMAGRADRTLDQYERDLSRVCLMYPSKGLLTGRVERNPMDRLPQIKRHGQRWYDVFSEAEVDDLTALPQVDAALTTILIEAGLRKSEARALQVRRVRLDTRELAIISGKGGKDRVIPMSERLHGALSDLLYLERLEPTDFLWYTHPGGTEKFNRSKPIGEGSFDRWWRRCIKTADVRYRNPHTTRHTFATRWLRRGGRLETLSIVMGHTSIKTTFDLYGHLDTRDAFADLALIDAWEKTPD